MNKSSYLVSFILALGVAYAAPQTAGPNQRTQSTLQASQAGQPGESGTSAQSGSATPAQNSSQAHVSGGPANASGEAVSGSAPVKTGNIQAAGAPQSAAAAPSDSELQSQIQQALDKEPTLAGRTVSVAVSGRSIDLSGSVANPRQKLTATRIVESYAANRKVVNHLTIGTAGGNTAGTSTGEKENDATSPGRTDLSSHPEPEKGSPPGSSSRPPQ